MYRSKMNCAGLRGMGMHRMGMMGGMHPHRPMHPPFMLFALIPILGVVLLFTLLKFLWPLLVIGMGFALMRHFLRGHSQPRNWESLEQEWQAWREKRKHSDFYSDKPKRDAEVEII